MAEIIAGCAAVAVAGGHVAVLNECLHVFNVGAALGDRPLVAWSSGCLAVGERMTLAIAEERALLEPLRAEADVVIDTSNLNVHQLRDRLRDLFAAGPSEHSLQTNIVSFGFKHGLPLDVDLVFDCRFLPNPHWVESLRPLPGTDPKVRRYVMKQAETGAFLGQLERLFALLLPAYVKEGKSYLSIGVGCTGGHHRSVVLAEELARVFERLGFPARVHHRDLERG